MNHPPLAPKSRIIPLYYPFFQIGRNSYTGDPDCGQPEDRVLIGSLAEVEWRKRAERWHVLCVRYEFDREEMDHDRITRFNKMEIICRQIAAEWRAWAEQ